MMRQMDSVPAGILLGCFFNRCIEKRTVTPISPSGATGVNVCIADNDSALQRNLKSTHVCDIIPHLMLASPAGSRTPNKEENL